jgi:hypothetical protein
LIKRSLEAGGLMTEKALVHAYACGVLSNIQAHDALGI